MTISIIVQRPPADYQGPDISDPLIASTAQAVARGTAEINKKSSNRVEVSGSMPLHPWMQQGKMVMVTELDGNQYMAMIRHCSITIDINGQDLSAVTNLILEREEEK